MTNNPSLKLILARPAGNHCLELEYSDGLKAQLDLSPALWGEFAAPLKDPTYFNKVAIDESGGTVEWPNEFDLCPDVLRYWAETGRVTSQEETDAHFAQTMSVAVAKVA